MALVLDLVKILRLRLRFLLDDFKVGLYGLHAHQVIALGEIHPVHTAGMAAHAAQRHADAVLHLAVADTALMIAVAGGFGGMLLVRRRVIGPVRFLTAVIGRLAGRDFATPVPTLGRHDEFEVMAKTLEELRTNAADAERLVGERQATQQAEVERATALRNLCRSFDAAVSQTLTGVGGATRAMTAAADEMAEMASTATTQTSEIATAVQGTVARIGAVSSAVTGMKASISEIAGNVERSAHDRLGVLPTA